MGPDLSTRASEAARQSPGAGSIAPRSARSRVRPPDGRKLSKLRARMLANLKSLVEAERPSGVELAGTAGAA
jgi:hypothetical protein